MTSHVDVLPMVDPGPSIGRESPSRYRALATTSLHFASLPLAAVVITCLAIVGAIAIASLLIGLGLIGLSRGPTHQLR